MDKKEAIRIIIQCANTYHQNLLNKNVMFVYRNKSQNKYECFEASFSSSNFCHLTGIERDERLSANDFFYKCIHHKLRLADFELREDGTTDMKLIVLPFMMKIHTVSTMTGYYNNLGIHLYTERIAGNTKGCMGFIIDGDYFIPNTVLNEDIRNITYSPEYRVVATFIKSVNEDKYTTLSYTAKGFDICQLTAVPTIAAKVDFAQFMGNQTDTEE